MLKLVLPKGSLEKATMELFDAADLGVRRGSAVNYKASIDDPRIESVRILRPQEIPTYVADGLLSHNKAIFARACEPASHEDDGDDATAP